MVAVGSNGDTPRTCSLLTMEGPRLIAAKGSGGKLISRFGGIAMLEPDQRARCPFQHRATPLWIHMCRIKGGAPIYGCAMLLV